MAGLPPHVGARRTRRREQLRRRRIAGVGGALVLLAAVLVVLGVNSGATNESTRRAQAAAPGSHRPPARLGGRRRGGHRPVEGAGSATIRRLVALGLPIYCGGSRGNEVALTFDDGPGPYTYLALRKLARAGERATFFVVGRSIDTYPGYLPRELRAGAIGDHTYTHPVLIALSPSMITWQLERTAQKIEGQSGEHVDLFRPPYELHNRTVDQIAKRLGLLEILWNVDSQDSLGANYARIIKTVEAGLHGGAIILMHENRGQTIRALTTLLPELHRLHLRSVSVPQLLASDPPSERQVRKGAAGCGVAAKVPRGPGD
jgi:peptidoglycan/xylan/chitin deacetylase (PgdA/CDA1 family)